MVRIIIRNNYDSKKVNKIIKFKGVILFLKKKPVSYNNLDDAIAQKVTLEMGAQ